MSPVTATLPAADEEDRWVPARLRTTAVVFVAPGSRRQDLPDRPRRCAEGGVPHLVRVEIVRRLRSASVEFFTLDGTGGYTPVAKAVNGERLTVDAPFPIDFDPTELLP